ncbi:MAG: phosphate ABC transporter substrate-binding protein [Anaerolineae bacterium]|nr:phosphate ABC transporter substrate-binding protein [Anaerolineae bacterium]
MRKHSVLRIPVLLAALSVLVLAGCRPGSDSEGLPVVLTSIQNKGSDTIVNLALAWAERYQTVRPEVSVAVTGGGSGTGIASLANGTVDIANASRAIKPEEIETARTNGVEPMEFIIARDAIAIIVHPSNPVDHLTLQQLSDIYSGKITNWRDLGGEDRPIVALSRETNSGTHVYFLESVIRLGDSDDQTLFSPNVLLLPSSEGIGAEVRLNPNAIGYDGLGYVTDDMKTLSIGIESSGPFWAPSADTVNDGQYPISRDLYMYTAGEPTGIIKDYIDWIMQPEAQAIVLDLGFVPNLE